MRSQPPVSLQLASPSLEPPALAARLTWGRAAQALVMPVAELTALCRARGIASLVDGAHGLAATPLRLSAAPPADADGWCGGADYYVGNCHKWFSAPRGAGFLRVNHAALAASAPEVPQ